LAFRIQVKKNSIENPFHTTSVTKDTHGSSPSLYFPKRSFYKIGGADLPPQGLLGFFEWVEGSDQGEHLRDVVKLFKEPNDEMGRFRVH
jgi:hypothetical protein